MQYSINQGRTHIISGLTRFTIFPARDINDKSIWLTREFDGEPREHIQFPTRQSAIEWIESGGDPAMVLIVARRKTFFETLFESA